MKNRIVGIIVVGISVLMGFMIWLFNNALKEIVNDSCSHGPTCPMWGSISFHTNLSLGIMVFVIVIGLYLIFFSKEELQIVKEVHRETRIVKEQIKPKKIDKGHFKNILESLEGDDRMVLESVIESQGTIFQSDLVSKLGLSKVKVTRILDRLEGRGLIERKRRGMTNVVILKY